MDMRASNTAVVLFVVIGTLLLLPGSLAAQDAGSLYGAAAPDDSAFVRVVHGGGSPPLKDIWIGATRFREVAPLSASPYRPVSPGIHQVFVGEQSRELIPRRGTYYTVLVTDAGPVILEDRTHTRPDRAQIVLYNFSRLGPIALRTADEATVVIGDVAAGDSGVIEVNAVAVDLALFRSSELLALVGDPGLERGQSYSVFVFGGHDEPDVFVERASLALE